MAMFVPLTSIICNVEVEKYRNGSVFVYGAGHPGVKWPSLCQKADNTTNQHFTNLPSHCHWLVYQRLCHVLSCLLTIMHAKDRWLSDVIVGHCVPIAGFCLSPFCLHELNRDISMIQSISSTMLSTSLCNLTYVGNDIMGQFHDIFCDTLQQMAVVQHSLQKYFICRLIVMLHLAMLLTLIAELLSLVCDSKILYQRQLLNYVVWLCY